jgi:hypothetical protein
MVSYPQHPHPPEEHVTAHGSSSDTTRIRRAALALGAASLVGTLLSGAFFPGARSLLVGVLPGLLAALIAETILDAALVSAVSVAAAAAMAPLFAVRTPGDQWQVVGGVLLAAAVAVVVALAARVLMATSVPRSATIVLGIALVFVVGSLWANSLYITHSTGDPTWAANLDRPIPGDKEMMDEGLFLYTVQQLRTGHDYYATMRGQLASELGKSALGYREPTLYWLLARLAGNGTGMIVLALLMTTVAVVSAFVLAGQLARWPLALVSAAAVAVYYEAVVVGPSLLDTEPWAAAFGLLAVALFAVAIRREDRARPYAWGAAAAAVVAVLFRELLLYVPLCGLLTTLVVRELRARRLWLPWASGLGLSAVVLALHWRATGGSLVNRLGGQWGWFSNAGWGKFWDALTWDQFMVGGYAWIIVVTLLLGWLAAVRARPTALRVFLPTVTIPWALGLALAGPALVGSMQFTTIGYWGAAVIPLSIALCGAGLALPAFAQRSE